MIGNRLTLFWFTSLLLLLPVDPFAFLDQSDKLYKSLFKLSPEESEWVENKLNELTLREKCAQMIFPFAVSKDTSENSGEYLRLHKLVTELKVGGIIFFQGEILKQASLTNKLQEISDLPLLICSDYERGLGMRLSDAVHFPYNMAVAAANDPGLTYLMGKYIAEEARALGVHINFAPLLDVNRDYRNPIINVRAYSEDPQIISLHGNAFIHGMHEGGMITTAKHFPGHGATDLDSHNELSIIELTREDLNDTDLVPFREAIKNGVKGVMIGHLEIPAYESTKGLPATLSTSVVNGLLKEFMQFKGLIITDAMNMHSIAKNYSQEEAAKLAVIAGNDIILFPVDEEAAVNGIYEAVLKNEIAVERIDHSVRKILAAKKWLELDAGRIIDFDKLIRTVDDPAHERLAAEIAEKSITLLKDDFDLIPIKPGDYYSTLIISLDQTISRRTETLLFEELIQDEFGYIRTYRINSRSGKNDYRNAKDVAVKSGLIILSINSKVGAFQGSVQLEQEHISFINELIDLKKPLIVVNFGNPYLLSEFPRAAAYICSFGDVDLSQRAMVNALLGKSNITGRLPVSVPNTNFMMGSGLNRIYNKLDFLIGNKAHDFSVVDSLIFSAVADSVFPGGVLTVGHKGKIIHHKAYGKFTYENNSQPVSTKTIYDLASLTKVVATTSAAMLLYDKYELGLDKPVAYYLPDFSNNGKEKITIRHLLLHNSGLPAFFPFHLMYTKKEEVLNHLMKIKLEAEPGAKYIYSDLGMIILQLVIESIAKMPIDEFLKENLFVPLGMEYTMFNPPAKYWYNCAPTERDNYWRMITLKGKVHDETAYILGGVAGHAGLFSTSHNLAVFAQTLLNGGSYGNKNIFKPETVNTWTTKQSKQSTRGLGWNIKNAKGYSSAGQMYSINSFGHTGFTGTSIWIDKERELFVILLTNRVHPTRENIKIIDFRPQLHDAVVKEVDYH